MEIPSSHVSIHMYIEFWSMNCHHVNTTKSMLHFTELRDNQKQIQVPLWFFCIFSFIRVFYIPPANKMRFPFATSHIFYGALTIECEQPISILAARERKSAVNDSNWKITNTNGFLLCTGLRTSILSSVWAPCLSDSITFPATRPLCVDHNLPSTSSIFTAAWRSFNIFSGVSGHIQLSCIWQQQYASSIGN